MTVEVSPHYQCNAGGCSRIASSIVRFKTSKDVYKICNEHFERSKDDLVFISWAMESEDK